MNAARTSERDATERHREIAEEFFDLVGSRRFNESLRLFADDCKTHNPYILGGIKELIDAMAKAGSEGYARHPEAELSVGHIVSEGDLVAAYTQILNSRANPSAGGLRQVHLFRFGGDKIVEYWDTTQVITPDMPNAGGAF